jgi:hypothetical protein
MSEPTKEALLNRVDWFKGILANEGEASFHEFLRATLAVFPFAEVEINYAGQLIVNTTLVYVEDKDGKLSVKQKDS